MDLFGVETLKKIKMLSFFRYDYPFDARQCTDHESEEISKIRHLIIIIIIIIIIILMSF